MLPYARFHRFKRKQEMSKTIHFIGYPFISYRERPSITIRCDNYCNNYVQSVTGKLKREGSLCLSRKDFKEDKLFELSLE